MTKVLFYQLLQERNKLSEKALSGELLGDPKMEVALARMVASSDLILDIVEGDLLDYLAETSNEGEIDVES